MITKQHIKRLEDSIKNLRGKTTFYCTKKHDEELYSYGGKIYQSLANVEADMDSHPGDILVIITKYGGSSFWDKSK